jgi:hypothetical protein
LSEVFIKILFINDNVRNFTTNPLIFIIGIKIFVKFWHLIDFNKVDKFTVLGI